MSNEGMITNEIPLSKKDMQDVKHVIDDIIHGFFQIGDYIRKHDCMNHNSGAIVYTIIKWHKVIWLDVVSNYCIMSESERDAMFDDLCAGDRVLLEQWGERWLRFIMDAVDQESPNMTDHRVGERSYEDETIC